MMQLMVDCKHLLGVKIPGIRTFEVMVHLIFGTNGINTFLLNSIKWEHHQRDKSFRTLQPTKSQQNLNIK